MGLFGNKAEKQEQRAAAQAECDRLLALPVKDLAAEIMRSFASDGLVVKSGHQRGSQEISKWLLADLPESKMISFQLVRPVTEGLQLLGNAGLVGDRSFGSSNSGKTYEATRLGESALADGSVRRQLGD